MTWVNAVVQGIFLGGLYALLACGLSLMFGVMRIINLAHGDIAVLGAFVMWWVTTSFGVNPWLALLLTLVVMCAFGYLLQRVVLTRALRAGVLIPLLATFGLSIVIQNGLLQVFSADVRSLGGRVGVLATGSWHVSGQLAIPVMGLVVLGAAVLVLGGLQLFLQRTGLGRE